MLEIQTLENASATPHTLGRATVSPDVLYQEIEGHAVLLDLVGERYYSLDDVGTRIWHLLTEDVDLDGVLNRLLDVYDIDRVTLSADLVAFVERLSATGLVTLSAHA